MKKKRKLIKRNFKRHKYKHGKLFTSIVLIAVLVIGAFFFTPDVYYTPSNTSINTNNSSQGGYVWIPYYGYYYWKTTNYSLINQSGYDEDGTNVGRSSQSDEDSEGSSEEGGSEGGEDGE